MTSMRDAILQALSSRHATDAFDAQRQISDDDLKTILESGRLAPSSFGLEPWQFIVIEHPGLREKIRAVAKDQRKITDAARLIIIARHTDTRGTISDDTIRRIAQVRDVSSESLAKHKTSLDTAVESRNDAQLDDWHARQTYIPLGMMTETAALLGINSTAIEGFDADAVDNILGLAAQRLRATVMLALGHARQDDARASLKKVRRSFEDVVSFVK